MLSDYFILGLKPDADDNQVRRHYLERVKRFAPETAPQQFQDITTAYERIKTKRDRIRATLLGPYEVRDSEQALRTLINACASRRRRAGLAELLNDLGKGRK